MLNNSLSRKIYILLLMSGIFLATWPFTTESWGKDGYELSPEEEFLFSDDEVVVSAAKYKQKVTESPSTIYIITAEEIRQSGLTYLPDILRRVPGLDVMTLYTTQAEVNIRGISQAPSNKTLVMIDGLSIYDRGYSAVIWNTLPVVLDDIKRIEVILGPGSALYGANAYSGLINIITKDPEETKNVHLLSSIGNGDTSYNSLLCGGSWDHWSWKMSAGWNQTDSFRDKKRSGDTLRYNYTLEYKENESSSVRFAGGMSQAGTEVMLNDQVGVFKADSDIYYATLSGHWQGLEVMGSYLSNLRAMSPISLPEDYFDPILDGQTYDLPPGMPVPVNYRENNYYGLLLMRQEVANYRVRQRNMNIQGQYVLDRADWYKLICGGSYYYYHVDWKIMADSGSTLDEASGFAQAVLFPVEGLSFTLGGRFDDYEVVGGQWSYRASLVYSKLKNSSFRLGYGTAFRNPSYFENFANMEIGLGGGQTVKIIGNEALDPESITTYEAGYQADLCNSRAKLQVNVFYNQIKDFIDVKPLNTAPPVLVSQYLNVSNAWAVGGEVALDMRWTEQLSSFVNYSFQELHFTTDDLWTLNSDEKGRRITGSPQHKVNLGINMNFRNGFSSNFIAHYVSGTSWDGNFASHISGSQDGYCLVTGRLAYRFWHERLEAAVSGNNLFNNREKQHPLSDEPETRILFSLRIDY